MEETNNGPLTTDECMEWLNKYFLGEWLLRPQEWCRKSVNTPMASVSVNKAIPTLQFWGATENTALNKTVTELKAIKGL